jgi:hypothetical protein
LRWNASPDFDASPGYIGTDGFVWLSSGWNSAKRLGRPQAGENYLRSVASIVGGHVRRPEKNWPDVTGHGSGCSEAGFTDAEQKLGSLPDQFNHEIATAFNLKDRGLIILTSCSHRGVVNAVRQAQEVSGVKKVHAIIGGFHLAPYPPEYLAQTIFSPEGDWPRLSRAAALFRRTVF